MYDRLILSPEQNLELVRRLPIVIKKLSSSKLTAHCPFHKDNTPSLGIDLKKGIYNCFSCNKSGTLAGLAYELVHKGAKAILQLEEKEVKELYTLNNIANNYYTALTPEEQLKTYDALIPPTVKGKLVSWRDNSNSVAFIRDRDIKPEVADAWGLQYAYNNFFYSNYNTEETDDGLLIKDRLVVPVRGPNRQILSYELRALYPGVKPKVLYLAPVDYLFRYPVLNKNKPLYLVEGMVDAARMFPYFRNITYTFGVSLTPLKIHLLKTFPEVIVIPDNDAPGYSLIENMLANDIKVSMLPIPIDYEDAGDSMFTYPIIEKWMTTIPIKATMENVKLKIEYFKTMTSTYGS